MGSADTLGEAFARAQLSSGQALPTQGTVFTSVVDRYKQESIELARRFVEMASVSSPRTARRPPGKSRTHGGPRL
jgi:hypothetical protein